MSRTRPFPPALAQGAPFGDKLEGAADLRNLQRLVANASDMEDAPEPMLDDAKAKAAHYRARAFEVRKQALAVNWTGLKASFLQIANFYDMLARQMEQAGANRLGQRPEDTSPNSSDKPKP